MSEPLTRSLHCDLHRSTPLSMLFGRQKRFRGPFVDNREQRLLMGVVHTVCTCCGVGRLCILFVCVHLVTCAYGNVAVCMCVYT